MVITKRKGRPRKITGTPEEFRLRALWRSVASEYYKKNREEILERVRVKMDVRCRDCAFKVFDPHGEYVYMCRIINNFREDPDRLRNCRKFRPREKE